VPLGRVSTTGSGTSVTATGAAADGVTGHPLETEAVAQAAPATPPQPARSGEPEAPPRPSPGLSSLLDGLSPFSERSAASHLALRSVAWARQGWPGARPTCGGWGGAHSAGARA